MDILIFAETDDKGNFKKDAFEIASYAYEISSSTLNRDISKFK